MSPYFSTQTDSEALLLFYKVIHIKVIPGYFLSFEAFVAQAPDEGNYIQEHLESA